MNDNELGNLIRIAREQAGMTLREVAEKAGIDHAYINHIEKGTKTNPSAEALQGIAEALDLDVSDLLIHIGIKPSSTLPSPRMYFRRKFGLNEYDADVLANLVEHQMNKREEDTNEENDEAGNDRTH